MKAALFAVALFFLLAAGMPAQEPSASPVPAAVSETNPIKMTPLQVAKMHGDILMARKEYREAIRAYDQVLRSDPKDAELLNKIGIAYQQLDYLKRAGHYYKASIKANKAYASALNNLGTVEYEERHYGKAIRQYDKAIPLKQDLSTVYSNLGYAYFAKKEYSKAMNTFEDALALDPDIFTRKSGNGTIVQQRTSTDPGLFYFLVAKTYALAGDAEHAAHYLKLARDDGYKDFLGAETDPAFAKVIKDPRVREVLVVPPSYAGNGRQRTSN